MAMVFLRNYVMRLWTHNSVFIDKTSFKDDFFDKSDYNSEKFPYKLRIFITYVFT